MHVISSFCAYEEHELQEIGCPIADGRDRPQRVDSGSFVDGQKNHETAKRPPKNTPSKRWLLPDDVG
jgi:hypothetical protein